MRPTTVKELYKSYESQGSDFAQGISLSGWIRTSRISKNFGFIELNDGSFFKNIQIVFEDNLHNYNEVSKLNVGASVQIMGQLVLTPEQKQPFEVKADEVFICGSSEADFPLQKKRHGFDFLRTIAHLRPRSNTFSAVFRVRSVAAYGFHKFFQENNFVYVHTPIITGSDCEGAGEMLRVTTLPPGEADYSKDFFGKESNLTVSGQLPAEALAMAFRNVYTFGPTFRAENSNTPRHAAEFWMIEPEMAFADLSDDMDVAEAMMKYVIQYVLDNAPEEMQFFNTMIDKELLNRLDNVLHSDFARITYTEAIEILEKNKENFEYPVFWGADIQTEHERYLSEQVYKKPVFVTDYPKEIKSFYMRLNDDNKTVAATDMLVPGIGELIGASQREERLDVLKQRMQELNLKEEDYWWYLELRRFGTCVHSGFGIGFERFIMYITGITNIRDVIPFPRTVNNLEF